MNLELVTKAKELGLNISRIAEIALMDAISRLDFRIEWARRELDPR